DSMTEMGLASAGGSRSRANGVPPPLPSAAMITRRGSILSVATASAAAAPEAPSNATAAASASSRQYPISSAVARQLTGVKTMPSNCNAQSRVAISYRFPHHHHEMVARPQPHILQAAGNGRDVTVPIGIAHATVAFDERLLTRLAHHRRGKRAAEIHGHDPLPMAVAGSSTSATFPEHAVHRHR